MDFTPPHPLEESGLILICNVNIVFGDLKFENSQDYAQKPQQMFMFMNSVSAQHCTVKDNELVQF
jgi:hypothetical protein